MARSLVTQGNGSGALALLRHGIANCQSRSDVAVLEKQRSLTLQTISILGQIATGKRTNKQRSWDKSTPAKAKPTKTSKRSDYYELIGQSVDDLAGDTFDGSHISLRAQRGKWTCLHVWATWCQQCRNAMEQVRADERRFAPEGVEFIGINIDPKLDQAKKYAEAEAISWRQLRTNSSNGWDAAEIKSLGVTSIPTSLLVSPEGIVVEGRIKR